MWLGASATHELDQQFHRSKHCSTRRHMPIHHTIPFPQSRKRTHHVTWSLSYSWARPAISPQQTLLSPAGICQICYTIEQT
jgi:hypothetical protein